MYLTTIKVNNNSNNNNTRNKWNKGWGKEFSFTLIFKKVFKRYSLLICQDELIMTIIYQMFTKLNKIQIKIMSVDCFLKVTFSVIHGLNWT